MIYLIDTNVLIEAHRAFYPFDVFPTYWSKLKGLADSRKIYSLDKVKYELMKNDDALLKWCNTDLPDTFFKDSIESIKHYQELISWANTQNNYTQAAKNQFAQASNADTWLLAFAMLSTDQFTIVTKETSNPNATKSIKIPDVAKVFGIHYLKPIEMLRRLEVTI